LLAAGESDGVQVGEKLVVRRPDPVDASSSRPVAELTVRTVKVDYAGAHIRPLVADGVRVTRWEIAERCLPKRLEFRPIGTIEKVDFKSRSAVARIDERSAIITPGQVVRWMPSGEKPPGAAIVLRCTGARAILYVPPGWGDLRDAPDARVEQEKRNQTPSSSRES